LSLTQFLPGPASSQLGFALGLLRAGWPGALAAFLAFTLPSALLLVLFAHLESTLLNVAGGALLHGLKLVAVCVVAQALLSMAPRLTPDMPRVCIALGAAVLVLLQDTAWAQLLAMLASAAAGALVCRSNTTVAHAALPGNRSVALVLLLSFIVLFLGSLTLDTDHRLLDAAAGFYRAGALVFGGGHVVLPLLEPSVVQPGLLSQQEFLAGYGAAQAIPGPMFSVAAYLGAKMGGYAGAGLCLVAIFLPGFLILGAALPVWSQLTVNPRTRAAFAGVNAGVIGLLAAAFWDPVCSEGIAQRSDVLIAVVGLALMRTRLSTLWVVVWCVAASTVRNADFFY
jgi:chromate transporter